MSVVHLHLGNIKRMLVKVLTGRGRKGSTWIQWFYPRFASEFCRLKKIGVKMTIPLVAQIEQELMSDAKGEFNMLRQDKDGTLIYDKITFAWAQAFCRRNNFVQRKQTGALMLSTEKVVSIGQDVGTHRKVKRVLNSGQLNESSVYNTDGAHTQTDMDNGICLGLCGDKEVTFQDVVSGGEGTELIAKIRGGPEARLETPTIGFQNENASYPIRSL